MKQYSNCVPEDMTSTQFLYTIYYVLSSFYIIYMYIYIICDYIKHVILIFLGLTCYLVQ